MLDFQKKNSKYFMKIKIRKDKNKKPGRKPKKKEKLKEPSKPEKEKTNKKAATLVGCCPCHNAYGRDTFQHARGR
jgi:hypothetical protein